MPLETTETLFSENTKGIFLFQTLQVINMNFFLSLKRKLLFLYYNLILNAAILFSLIVLVTNEFLVSGWGVNGTYAVGRASVCTKRMQIKDLTPSPGQIINQIRLFVTRTIILNRLGNSFGIMKFTGKRCVFSGFFFACIDPLKRSQYSTFFVCQPQ